MSNLFVDIDFQLDQLICVISQLENSNYSSTGKHIHSIGSHVRHVIEYIQILSQSDLAQPIDYSLRNRDIRIETDRAFASEILHNLKSTIRKEDCPVIIKEELELFNSSYHREILYMHEHIVHHCAIIRIELQAIPNFELDHCFGYAKSTLKHMTTHVSS